MLAHANRNYVGVVVRTGENGRFVAAYESCTRALDKIHGHLLAVARTAQHDPKRIAIKHGGFCRRDARKGIIILRLVRVGAVVEDFMAIFPKLRDDQLFHLKACVVSANMYTHAVPFSDGH